MRRPIDFFNAKTLHRFNAKTLHRALDLMRDGKVVADPRFKKGYDLIAGMRWGDFLITTEIIVQEGKTSERLQAICKRHKSKETETLERVVERAAKAGDEDAIDVLASGILQEIPSLVPTAKTATTRSLLNAPHNKKYLGGV
jgi:hypothetical protein